MSAFVLAEPHLRALTNFAFAYGVEEIESFLEACRPEEAHRDAFGRLLLEENVRSGRARYPDLPDVDLIGPGPLTFQAGPKDGALHDPITIIQACSCFDHQACEAEDYWSTWAAAAVNRIRRAACNALLLDMRIPDRRSGRRPRSLAMASRRDTTLADGFDRPGMDGLDGPDPAAPSGVAASGARAAVERRAASIAERTGGRERAGCSDRAQRKQDHGRSQTNIKFR